MGRNAGGRSGTLALAASLVLLRGRGRMGRTDWRKEGALTEGQGTGDSRELFKPTRHSEHDGTHP